MDDLTEVELYWQKGRIERWIRFGRVAQERIIDRRRRIVLFSPGSIFAFVRWAANEHGTIASRIDILRAAQPGKPISTVPGVRPGGEILLRLAGWPKVERVLKAIDAIEALGVERTNRSLSCAVGGSSGGDGSCRRRASGPRREVSGGEGLFAARRPAFEAVVALPGQTVCRNHLAVMIDGVVMSIARERDHLGRPLPAWQGCHMIGEGKVFLMNWQSDDSLDGRYFGPLPAA
jgi:Protein of unknown function (DUF2840)/Signal peptidase, peptidase S26